MTRSFLSTFDFCLLLVLTLNDLGGVEEDGKDEEVVEGCKEDNEGVVDGTEDGGEVVGVVLAAVVWGVVRLGETEVECWDLFLCSCCNLRFVFCWKRFHHERVVLETGGEVVGLGLEG